jgi:ribonuclease G
MQITRQRVRPAVEMEVMETCPTCMGKGKIQSSILFTDKLTEEIQAYKQHFGRGLRLHLHPYIYAYVSKGWIKSQKSKWRIKYGVHTIENQSLGMLETKFYNRKGKELTPLNTGEQNKAPEKQK